MIRPATPADKAGLMTMIEAVGLFPPQELEELDSMLSGYFADGGGEGHFWVVDDNGGVPAGVAYYAPERMTLGTWNLYLIAVHPGHQKQGRGAALLRYVERALTERGERLLLVETSGMASFQPVRDFYRNCGYEEEARIRDFYKAGDDKVVFRKALNSGNSQ